VPVSSVTIHVDEKQIRLMNAPGGEVYGAVRDAGTKIERMAKRLVRVKTGGLRASIRSPMSSGATYVECKIGSNKRHALMEHEGTKPHVILPHGQYLRFRSRGRVIYARRVLHPGTRGTHYLTIPLQIYGRLLI